MVAGAWEPSGTYIHKNRPQPWGGGGIMPLKFRLRAAISKDMYSGAFLRNCRVYCPLLRIDERIVHIVRFFVFARYSFRRTVRDRNAIIIIHVTSYP